MSNKTNTKMVTCPVCGEPAKFNQHLIYGAEEIEPLKETLELECPTGCQPSDGQLRTLLPGTI